MSGEEEAFLRAISSGSDDWNFDWGAVGVFSDWYRDLGCDYEADAWLEARKLRSIFSGTIDTTRRYGPDELECRWSLTGKPSRSIKGFEDVYTVDFVSAIGKIDIRVSGLSAYSFDYSFGDDFDRHHYGGFPYAIVVPFDYPLMLWNMYVASYGIEGKGIVAPVAIAYILISAIALARRKVAERDRGD